MLNNIESLKQLFASRLRSMPSLPPNFTPSAIEIFDQHGLLVSMVLGEAVYESERSVDESEYLAWFLDGEIGLLIQNGEIVINRLENMALSHQMLEEPNA
ncbi:MULTISPECIES: hypothetical protein [unclassified Coleofasciculus]|uniref:hypothetical protein n=1 Tax=unclassified Coleofasciculus TaxID=2692782 RepID=UPI00187F6F14|nr:MULTISPECIES: hypothetical protein [unclassified Coleofasciculus]MBE9128015.1 hypothetical protein [Coleofasciculus sp. LEGE 07081]MBE9150545.1 hypothetical protein [Coleofasciculus sp. LEGE 07092]